MSRKNASNPRIKKNLQAPKLSHHERSPGSWILRDEIAICGHKKRNHPTLAQLDGDWGEN